MSKAHSNKGRVFVFKSQDNMLRFILLYKDLFTPYSEYVCDYESINLSGHFVNNYENTYKIWIKDDNYGEKDSNKRKMLEQGYRIFDNNMIRVNLTPDSLDKILGSNMFEKIRVQRGRFYYYEKD